MWTSHWYWSKTSCNSHSVSLFVCLFQFSFFFHLTNFSFWFFDLNTETKDWHQKFLQIVLRNLLNWCKCVGRENLNNVLYPLFFVFSFQTHNNSIIWFVSSLIEMLIGFWNDLFNVGTIEENTSIVVSEFETSIQCSNKTFTDFEWEFCYYMSLCHKIQRIDLHNKKHQEKWSNFTEISLCLNVIFQNNYWNFAIYFIWDNNGKSVLLNCTKNILESIKNNTERGCNFVEKEIKVLRESFSTRMFVWTKKSRK
jgi:hypothetical protein